VLRASHLRSILTQSVLGALVVLTAGCGRESGSLGHLDKIWGQRGNAEGRLQKPRAMAIDDRDELYIVDMTARIQVFDTDGEFLRGWQTPDHTNGRPTGISLDRQGRVLVADTHYYRILIYSREGELLQTIGGKRGPEPGNFGFVTDCVQDSQGNLYVSEYGDWDRIQKFSPEGKFLLEWGQHGSEPGQFARPQDLCFDEQDRLWVADSCNHRIQVFDTQGKLITMWGTAGTAPGQLYYPYDLAFDHEGNLLICEYGNHRVQRFTREGKSLGCWGKEGRGPGELFNPWAVVVDKRGRIIVLDTNNHRIQRVVL
jgi:DNA-binding beta-propeller fold protein YncE